MSGYLIEVDAAVDAAGTTETFRLSTVPFQTRPSDTPANQNYINAVMDPGSLGISAYGDGRTSGYGKLEVGQIKLANNEGDFDGWLDYGFDGRQVRILRRVEGQTYPYFPTLFTGTIDGPIEVSRSAVVLRIRDKQFVLEVPGRPNLYGGTNVLPNGADGTPEDLKGKRKVRVYGYCRDITPDLVNTSLLIYKVNDGAVYDIPAVYDQGAAKTKGADYADLAALSAATIASGAYATCKAEGLFRLNAAPLGQITCDVSESSPTDMTAPDLIRRIALAAGLPYDEISATDVDSLRALQPAITGIYIEENMTAREAIHRLAASIGAYVIFDLNGILRMGLLTDPATASPAFVWKLTDSQLLTFDRVAQRDGDLPVWQVRLQHTRCWTPQSSGLAGSLSMARRNFLKDPYRVSPAEDATVKQRYLMAEPWEAETLIDDPTNAPGGPAALEALRRLDLYKVRRDVFEATVHLSIVSDYWLPQLMTCVEITTPRFGMSSGRRFWVIGIRMDFRRNQAVLSLWG